MTDAVYVEMPAERHPFWKSKFGLMVFLFLGLVILAGLFSWWLSQGKISSVAARLDTLVYTVEPQFSTQVRDVYARPGEMVNAGQPLARVDVTAFNPAARKAEMDLEQLRKIPGMRDIADRLGAARKAESDMAAKLNQARTQEEQVRRAMQERVTEHVRSQLAMRSLDSHNRAAYERASQAEQAARSRMEAAKGEFERVSRMRAAMDAELNRIRGEIAKTRRSANLGEPPSEAADQNGPAQDDYLYSPVNGRVVRVNAVQGQTVVQGTPLFFILPNAGIQNADYWIQAWFPIADARRIEPGQTVSVRFENAGLHLTGKVEKILEDAHTAPAQPGSVDLHKVNGENKYTPDKYIPVRISLEYPAEAASLEPGAKADCQIQTRYLFGL